MRISTIPAAVSLRTGWKIIGSRPTGSRCLLVTLVSGNRREAGSTRQDDAFHSLLLRRRALCRNGPQSQERLPKKRAGHTLQNVSVAIGPADEAGDAGSDPRIDAAGDRNRVRDHRRRPQHHRDPHPQRDRSGQRHPAARPLKHEGQSTAARRGRMSWIGFATRSASATSYFAAPAGRSFPASAPARRSCRQGAAAGGRCAAPAPRGFPGTAAQHVEPAFDDGPAWPPYSSYWILHGVEQPPAQPLGAPAIAAGPTADRFDPAGIDAPRGRLGGAISSTVAGSHPPLRSGPRW